jgi:subtilisin-like proprotein convertase family protein
MKSLFLFFSLLILTISTIFAQNNKPQRASYIGQPDRVIQIPSIASRIGTLTPVDLLSTSEEMQDGRSAKYNVIPGKGSKGADALALNPSPLKNSVQARMPNLVFETAASNSQPTDPAGAVGPNHYVTVTNTAFRIFDKNGTPLTNLLSPNPTIFPNGGCCDLTVSYDNRANRWVLTFLGGGVQIAVSNGPDPINDGWTTYTYTVVNDYNKLSIWSDGYYLTENTGAAEKLHVFDRDAMLNGDLDAAIQSFVLPGIVTSGFHSPQALNITDNNFPNIGNCPIVYLQDDAFGGGITQDHVKLWTCTVDWDNPTNSIVSAASQLGIDAGTGTVTPFVSVFDGGSFANLAQPNGGASIDALQGIIMNQAQFRKFQTYNSGLFNFVVDVAAGPTKQAGVRWYEIRQAGDGQPWSIFQEGTYTAPDNKHAWNASLAMDSAGNIGMGYSTMSSPNSTDPNIRVSTVYTGQTAGTANTNPGIMNVSEEIIMLGNANIPGVRYADYSKIDVDPSNDKEFWFVNEIMSNGRKNIAGVFQIATDTSNDVGVVAINNPSPIGTFTNTQEISVTLYNYGTNTAANFEVAYQIDGGTVITEIYPGTLAPDTFDNFTFTTTADMSAITTFTVNAETNMTTDEDTGNDFTVCQVQNIAANDIGIVAITSPSSGEGLGNETVTVTIQNFGGVDQTGFNVNYIVDSGTPIVEAITANLPAGETISYPFATTTNLSTLGNYALSSSTLLVGDSNPSNDSFMTTVANVDCNSAASTDTPVTISATGTPTITSTLNFPDDFVINDVNVTLNIQHTWIPDLIITLTSPGGTTVELSSDIGNPNDDDMVNTVFDDSADILITEGTAPFTGVFRPEGNLADFNMEQSAGDWVLTISDTFAADGGQLTDWTLQLCSSSSLSVGEQLVEEDLIIINQGNDQYKVKLPTSSITDRLSITVFNILGQTLSHSPIENRTGQGYEYDLNMSYVASGVYLIRVGNNIAGNVKRIIID